MQPGHNERNEVERVRKQDLIINLIKRRFHSLLEGATMSMEKISEDELKKLQKKYGFRFCRIKGTQIINITKHDNPRFDVIDFDEFTKTLKKRKLAVYKSNNDFLKIMKNKQHYQM